MKYSHQNFTATSSAARYFEADGTRMQAAALPYADKTRSFAEHRPVLFVIDPSYLSYPVLTPKQTFLALFTAFSIVPVLCFA